MFLIIGVWGGARRVYASFKFFLYTFLGSVLMLLAMMAMYWEGGTTDIPTLMGVKFPADMQWWLWLAFFASFAVKLPMWPVHTWLPDAHVEAPTAGSVILAGILLKMGGYGFLRFSLPMFPVASLELAPFVFVLSVVAIIYTSLVALAQEDVKKLIAYSSVAHMGFVTMGIFTFTQQGVDGAIFQMLSHGLVSAALFLCVGVIYGRARGPDANLRGVLHGVYSGQCRIARYIWIRRRVPDATFGVQSQHARRFLCDRRGHSFRGIRAVALQARHLRRA
jgi:NADH-quinone oxidoreductase subunit M